MPSTTPKPTRETAANHRPVGRPPLGSEDKRERILVEAIGQFALNGYAGTSLSDIARLAGISKSGLLHHFGSKEQLFAAVLDHRDEVSTAPWASIGADPWEFMDHFVSLIDSNQRDEPQVRLYTSVAAMGVSPDNPAHEWLRGHFQLGTDNFVRRLEAGKAAGTVHADAPSAEIARLFLAAADGIQTQWLCQLADGPHGGAEIEMAAHLRLLVDLIKGRWATRPPQP